MSTTSGRFSSAAAAAQQATPTGISRREGQRMVLLVALQVVVFGIAWQCHRWQWGGIIEFAAFFAYFLLIITLTSSAARFRGVHPRGFRRAWYLAGAWNVAVVVIASGFWVYGHAPAPWPLTTCVAVVANIPEARVAARLVREGR